jgi:hypothetical protein
MIRFKAIWEGEDEHDEMLRLEREEKKALENLDEV